MCMNKFSITQFEKKSVRPKCSFRKCLKNLPLQFSRYDQIARDVIFGLCSSWPNPAPCSQMTWTWQKTTHYFRTHCFLICYPTAACSAVSQECNNSTQKQKTNWPCCDTQSDLSLSFLPCRTQQWQPSQPPCCPTLGEQGSLQENTPRKIPDGHQEEIRQHRIMQCTYWQWGNDNRE